jgi:hypothetical protein
MFNSRIFYIHRYGSPVNGKRVKAEPVVCVAVQRLDEKTVKYAYTTHCPTDKFDTAEATKIATLRLKSNTPTISGVVQTSPEENFSSVMRNVCYSIVKNPNSTRTFNTVSDWLCLKQ